MKRWLFLALVAIIILAGLFALRLHFTTVSPPSTHLARTPNSAYKYNLCMQAYAWSYATPDNPYKTDYTFQDPFRKANDTIIPRLMNLNKRDNTVTFDVKITINQVTTFNDSISHVRALDGISILLPDSQNHLQRSTVPQFIISFLSTGGGLAVLDFTCPNQWVWKALS